MTRKFFSVLLGVVIALSGMAGCVAPENAAASISESSQSSEPLSASEATGEPESAPEPSVSEEEPPPDNDWKFDSPENHGVDGEILESFHSVIADTGIYSAVTVKDGVVIDEYYKDGYDENSVFGLASCTKSFSGALIGIAIDKGVLSGVDARLSEFFPQLSAPENADKQDITVEHLLTHTSGIQWSEWAGGDYFRRLSQSENWVEFVLSQPMASAPGAVFNYTTGGSHLLGAVIEQAAGITEYEFGVEHLFGPLGMDSVQWRSDPQGITDGGNGISMTARDAAKFGQLYLDGGRWKGKQIISEEWVRLSVERQAAGSPGTGEYGYSWWLKAFGNNTVYDVYYAMGHGGRYIFVVPELALVTVIAGRLDDTYAPQYYFNDYVIPACG